MHAIIRFVTRITETLCVFLCLIQKLALKERWRIKLGDRVPSLYTKSLDKGRKRKLIYLFSLQFIIKSSLVQLLLVLLNYYNFTSLATFYSIVLFSTRIRTYTLNWNHLRRTLDRENNFMVWIVSHKSLFLHNLGDIKFIKRYLSSMIDARSKNWSSRINRRISAHYQYPSPPFCPKTDSRSLFCRRYRCHYRAVSILSVAETYRSYTRCKAMRQRLHVARW